jgi:hypothetical protein
MKKGKLTGKYKTKAALHKLGYISFIIIPENIQIYQIKYVYNTLVIIL